MVWGGEIVDQRPDLPEKLKELIFFSEGGESVFLWMSTSVGDGGIMSAYELHPSSVLNMCPFWKAIWKLNLSKKKNSSCFCGCLLKEKILSYDLLNRKMDHLPKEGDHSGEVESIWHVSFLCPKTMEVWFTNGHQDCVFPGQDNAGFLKTVTIRFDASVKEKGKMFGCCCVN